MCGGCTRRPGTERPCGCAESFAEGHIAPRDLAAPMRPGFAARRVRSEFDGLSVPGRFILGVGGRKHARFRWAALNCRLPLHLPGVRRDSSCVCRVGQSIPRLRLRRLSRDHAGSSANCSKRPGLRGRSIETGVGAIDRLPAGLPGRSAAFVRVGVRSSDPLGSFLVPRTPPFRLRLTIWQSRPGSRLRRLGPAGLTSTRWWGRMIFEARSRLGNSGLPPPDGVPALVDAGGFFDLRAWLGRRKVGRWRGSWRAHRLRRWNRPSIGRFSPPRPTSVSRIASGGAWPDRGAGRSGAAFDCSCCDKRTVRLPASIGEFAIAGAWVVRIGGSRGSGCGSITAGGVSARARS